MISPPETKASWRDLAAVRVAGSALAWFVYSLSMSLLFLSAFIVMSMGGFCASGGPYVIEDECPEAVVAFAPLSFPGLFVAVGIALYLARGFGAPLVTWGWPLLFGSLGWIFLYSFFVAGDTTGLGLGIMFEVMAVVPLVIELWGSPQRVFLGATSASGERFREGPRARRSLLSVGAAGPPGTLRPNLLHWILSLGIPAIAGWSGIVIARGWFFG